MTIARPTLRPLLVVVVLAALALPAPTLAAGPPEADPQTVRAPQDNPLVITLTARDPDGDGVLTYLTTAPAHGLVTLTGLMDCTPSGINCSADVTYTPEAGYQGLDSFTFTVTDADLPVPETSAPATVSITVNALPVAVDDPSPACWDPGDTGGSFPIPEDWPEPLWFFGSCALVTNDTDADDDSLSYQIVTGPASGEVVEVDSTSIAYQPDPDFSTIAGDQPGGTWVSDTVTYRAFDGFEPSAATATMRIWVAPINDPPSFTPGDTVEIDEDSGAYSAAWATAISPGPASESSQTVTFEIVDLDVTGVPNLFAVDPAIDSSGVLTFTPAANEYGLATVTIRAVDDGGLEDYNVTYPGLPLPDDTSDEAMFTIVVWPVADPPLAENATASTAEDTPVDIDLVGTDVEGDALTFPTSDPVHGSLAYGTLSCGGGGCTQRVTYTPDAGYAGSDSFTFTAESATAPTTSNEATVSVTIGGVNDAPTFTKGTDPTVLEDSGPQTMAGWATAISPGAGDSGQAVAFAVTGNTNPTLFASQPAVASNGTLSFTPAANRSGSATISLVLHDDGGTANGGADASATANFQITVSAVNDPPNAANDVGLTVNQNTPTGLAVLANDSALPDTGETLSIIAVSAPSHGTATISGGGSAVSYVPAPTYRGSDSFTYTVSDGSLTDTATVLLTVVAAGTVSRLAGADRYATSAAISGASFSPNVPVVYIATGGGFADALSGAPVAALGGGPVLLVPGTTIPTVIGNELIRLKPARIVILGGTGVVSAGVESSLGFYTSGP